MKFKIFFLFFTFLTLTTFGQEPYVHKMEVVLPKIILSDLEQEVELHFSNNLIVDSIQKNKTDIYVNGKAYPLIISKDKIVFKYRFLQKEILKIQFGTLESQPEVDPIPLWLSILPPLIAIAIALLFKEVFVALFIGILSGTTIIHFYQGSNFFVAIFKGILSVFDTYVVNALTDSGHISIIVFTMTIGGMVQLISKNGGMKGAVYKLSRYAKTARSGQFITWLMGVCIFFDDYANTLVVGNTLRPITDKLRISREKLAYLVDSTAAPVAAVAFVTTWIGAELSYIQDGISTIGIEESPYSVFFNSLGYSFYSFLALTFMLLLIWRQRDYGPMFKAEQKARKTIPNNVFKTEKTEAEEKPRAYNALIPVLVLIIGMLVGLLVTGWNEEIWNNKESSFSQRLSGIIGNADSYVALLWSSLLSLITALILTVSQKLMKLKDAIEAVVDGYKLMLTAIMILSLAWSIALITEDLHTAEFISASLLKLSFSPYLVPALTFILAAFVSFSTGSSWGTMAILYPLLLPTSWLLTSEAGMETSTAMNIFYNVVASVMAGSVFGDHCSPISDTTILSSLSSSCNHISHVRTQLPYALTVGAVSILVGTIPAAFGVPLWILFIMAVVVLFAIIQLFGKKQTDS